MQTRHALEAIDRLTVERGEKKDGFYYATFSCKDVLDRMSFEINRGNLRQVAYIITKGYTDSVVVPGDREVGCTLKMKVRSK